MNEIIFQNRNKLYGAYVLRMNYEQYMRRAFILAIISFIFILLYVHFVSRTSVKQILLAIPIDMEKGRIQLTNDIPVMENIVKKNSLMHSEMARINSTKVVDDKQIIREVFKEEQIPTKTFDNESGQVGSGIDLGEDGGNDKSGAIEKSGSANTEIPPSLVEHMPEFQGGLGALYKFLSKNIKYPQIALENGIEGKVLLQFIINIDGSISGIELVRGIGGGCDEEAIRVIKMLPNWKPGKMNNQAVAVRYTLPVNFKLIK